jgi:hypothetical protein
LNADTIDPKLAIIDRRRFVLHVHAFLPEETTMTHLCKRAGLTALLAALIFAAPLAAADPEKPKPDLAKKIDLLTQAVAAMQDQLRDIEEVRREDTKKIGDDINSLRRKVDQLERQIRRNAEEISDLRSKADTRSSLSVDPIVPVTGTVRLMNRLAVPATVTINGVAYSVPALNATLVRGIPAGALTYVANAPGMGEGVPVRSRVNANETLTITIFDPALRP